MNFELIHSLIHEYELIDLTDSMVMIMLSY